MKAGIQYADGLSVQKICESGFREIELSIKNYDKLDEIKGKIVAGEIVVSPTR